MRSPSPHLLLLCGLLAALTAMPAAAQGSAAPTGDFRLSDVRWERRVLVLFAPSQSAPAYGEQQRRFQAAPAAAFAERDLLLVEALGSGDGRRRTWEPGAESHPVQDGTAARLRERFDVPDDAFALVLVGKDGTEKRRDPTPVAPGAIFDEIDAMPMRQREMRAQEDGQ